jgi:hypothetical protein
LQWSCTSGEILALAWPEPAMVTAAAATCFLGSIAVRCAHPCACGLESRGKPQTRDRALEALLCLFPVGGIASESPTIRVWEKLVAVGLLCEVQVCSLAKMMSRAEDGSRRGFGSWFARRVRWVLLLAVLLWSRRCGVSVATMTGCGWSTEFSVGARPAYFPCEARRLIQSCLSLARVANWWHGPAWTPTPFVKLCPGSRR